MWNARMRPGSAFSYADPRLPPGRSNPLEGALRLSQRVAIGDDAARVEAPADEFQGMLEVAGVVVGERARDLGLSPDDRLGVEGHGTVVEAEEHQGPAYREVLEALGDRPGGAHGVDDGVEPLSFEDRAGSEFLGHRESLCVDVECGHIDRKSVV